MSATDHFSQDTTVLPESRPTEIVDVAAGGSFELRLAPMAKRIGDAEVRMLAYNGSVPGPTLRVAEGSQIEVDVVNEGDLEATVHWHGLRLDNRSDGTHETQAPIPIGGRFACTVAFPDPGLYWYMARAGSSCSPATAKSSRTSCGATRCSFAPARRSTSCSR
jgi:FtsP/CotA-like multicopper oxidase with cupredoxin domain